MSIYYHVSHILCICLYLQFYRSEEDRELRDAADVVIKELQEAAEAKDKKLLEAEIVLLEIEVANAKTAEVIAARKSGLTSKELAAEQNEQKTLVTELEEKAAAWEKSNDAADLIASAQVTLTLALSLTLSLFFLPITLTFLPLTLTLTD
jgi:hypothetical protein